MSTPFLQPDATLVCSMGLPFSGKSQWVRDFAQANACPIVSPDMLRLAIHGQPYIQSAEPFVWATAHAMVTALFLAGHRRVVLDATNTTRKARDAWRDERWQTAFQVLGTHPVVQADLCRAAAVAADRLDMLAVIDRMAAQWEPLGPDELCWGPEPLRAA